MELGEIIGYAVSALGGGGVMSIINWQTNKRKAKAEVKSDEIENMRKAMEDFYTPLVKKQNERISELEDEVKTLRQERMQMEQTYQRQIVDLQRQIVEITRALGIKANKQVRDNLGRYTSEKEEA